MTSFVNPLLLGQHAVTTGSGRDYLRSPDAVAANAQNANFAKQLADAQAGAPAAGPTATVNAAPAPDKVHSDTDVASARIDRRGASVQEEDDFTFDDLVDLVNPLQHIPIVGTLYRAATDDQIKPVTRMVGDVAYGALVGGVVLSAVSAVFGAIVESQTGETPDMMIANAIFGRDKEVPPAGEQQAPVMVASAATPAETAADATNSLQAQSLPVQDAPVQTAALETDEAKAAPVKTAGEATNNLQPNIAATGMPGAKAPFGGVMDLAGAQHRAVTGNAPQLAQVMTQTPTAGTATRIGNVIYTSPAMRNAAKVAAENANRAKMVAIGSAPAEAAIRDTAPAAPASPTSAQAANFAEAKAVSSLIHAPAGLSLPGQEAKNNPKIGDLAPKSDAPNVTPGGNKLPNDLVRDMMMMALDKYKNTAGMAASEMKLGSQTNTLN